MSLEGECIDNIILKDANVFFSPNLLMQGSSVVVENGTISNIINEKEDINHHVNVTDYTVIDCKNKLLLPGFVDPHTHPMFSGNRAFELELKIKGLSYLEIQQRGGGINYTVSKTRQADQETLKSTLQTISSMMLRHGTTTMEAKTGYHLTVEGELLALEIIDEVNASQPIDLVPTFLGAHLIPPEYKNHPNEYVDLIIDEMLPKVAKQGIAKFTDVFCDSGAFTVEQTIQILERSLELNIPVRVHAEQFAHTGISKIAAEQFKAFSVDHLLEASFTDLQSLKDNNTTAIIIPNDPIVLFSEKWPPYRLFKQHGGPIAIATDFNPNNWLTNMALSIYLASYMWRFTPSQAIEFASRNAARSLGLNDRGEVKIGNTADLIVYDFPSPEYIPYYCGQVTPFLVIKRGKIVHQSSKL